MHAAQAVEEALKSQGNARVGAFIARGDKGLCAGHKCDRHGLHAEQVGLDKGEEQHIYLRGADLYTTLEPYAKSRTNRVPCAELISQVGTSVVHIGTYDPSLHLLRLDGAEGVEVVR